MILTSFFYFTSIAHATVYFTAYDPKSGAIALVYSSSGGNFWQTLVKSKGLIGAQASGLCGTATPEIFLEEGLSAEAIGQQLKSQCDQENFQAYRLSIITTDGKMSSVIAEAGCHSGNINCGTKKTKDFMITGGGLEEGVLEKATSFWETLLPQLPFKCKLLFTLKWIYLVGGEKHDFAGASITIDDPRMDNLVDWQGRGAEATLIPQISDLMKKDGYNCKID